MVSNYFVSVWRGNNNIFGGGNITGGETISGRRKKNKLNRANRFYTVLIIIRDKR
jgi:hypothetical protein